MFKKIFIQRVDYGTEYFSGDVNQMVKQICEIVSLQKEQFDILFKGTGSSYCSDEDFEFYHEEESSICNPSISNFDDLIVNNISIEAKNKEHNTISLDLLKKKILNDDIDELFANMFFKKGNNNDSFIYSHAEIGKYLEYSDYRNYEDFRLFVRENLDKDIDYIMIKISGNKEVYYMTRLGFHKICVYSSKKMAKIIVIQFAKVYNTMMKSHLENINVI
jgi:hypothetical protein